MGKWRFKKGPEQFQPMNVQDCFDLINSCLEDDKMVEVARNRLKSQQNVQELINSPDEDGNMLLNIVVNFPTNYPEVDIEKVQRLVNVLIELGANPGLLDGNGCSAFQLAEECKEIREFSVEIPLAKSTTKRAYEGEEEITHDAKQAHNSKVRRNLNLDELTRMVGGVALAEAPKSITNPRVPNNSPRSSVGSSPRSEGNDNSYLPNQ